MKIQQFIKNRKIWLDFLFSLLQKVKFIYLLLVLTISLGISGWSVESTSVRIPIIGFHDIVDIQNRADLPPRRLAFENDYTKQNLSVFLEYLFKNQYWFLSAQDLYVYFIKKSQPIPTQYLGHKPIMLSFDDGYEGVHKNGFPILEKLSSTYKENGKFVLFVNPLFLGVDMGGDFLPHASCQDLRTGYQKGLYDVQSHGFSHKRLTKLSGKDLEFEIAKSKSVLRKCMGDLDKNKVIGAHIAYPYGALNRKVEKILPKYHLTGFLYNDGYLRVKRLRNNYRISRITVSKDMSPAELIYRAQRASTLLKKKGWF